MPVASAIHSVGNKVHKVERVAHAVAHPGSHAKQSVRWRVRRVLHGVFDRFLRCCCCGML